MRKLFMMLAVLLAAMRTASADRIRENFDFGWQFRLGDSPSWTDVRLPHDWSIELDFDPNESGASGFLAGGIGHYRKSFELPSSSRGKEVSIVFDGIYHKATIILNGHKVGYHRYGYTSFEYDLTPYVNFGGENEMEVTVDHSEVSRWYTGSGIYRHAWLLTTDKLRVCPWGVYVTTPYVSDEKAAVNVATSLRNDGTAPRNVTVSQILLDRTGKAVPGIKVTDKVSVAAGDSVCVSQSFNVPNPHRWDVTDPYVYKVRTEVRQGGRVIDSYESPLGFRTLDFTSDKGFFLNGRRLKFKGVCLHQDAGVLGTGVPDRSFERRLQKLKEFGVNAIRCSHNPPAPEFLEMCDTLGFVVIDEAFDKWKSGYYAEFFDSCWRQDIGDMVLRDRNHPSIVLWSIGNEVAEDKMTSDEGVDRARMLQDYVHQLEPTRMCLVACMNKFEDKFGSVTDVVGYNYMEPRMIRDHKLHPERRMVATEVFPYYCGRYYQSSRDYYPRNPWYYVEENDFIAGSFMWAGVAYIGESELWPSKGWACAPFDMTMTEMPVAFVHRTLWDKDTPMLKIMVNDNVFDMDPGKDHWEYPPMIDTWDLPYPQDKMVDVCTVTTCDSVALYTVSERKGTTRFFKRATADYESNTIHWMQPFRPGKVVAIGYKNGVEVCRDSLVTTGGSQAVRVSVDRPVIKADGQDLAYVDITLVDNDGRMSRMDDRTVTVEVSGPGRLRGIDSGEMRREKSFMGNSLKTWFGKACAVVQADRTAGEVTVTIKVDGIPDVTTATIRTR